MNKPFFVYGTLMTGYGNHRVVMDYVKDIKEATVKGFDIYPYGGFPFVKPGNSVVMGQLIYVNDDDYQAALQNCDWLEGYTEGRSGNMYERETVTVTTEDGKEVEAWIYVGHSFDSSKKEKIESGSWRDYTDNRLVSK